VRKNQSKKRVEEMKKDQEAPASSVDAVAVAEDTAAKDDLINVDEASPEMHESATLLQGQVRKNQSKKRVAEMKKEKNAAITGGADAIAATESNSDPTNATATEDAAKEAASSDNS
jgi:hypothetical protein